MWTPGFATTFPIRKVILFSSVSAASFALGVGSSYLFLNKRIEAKYVEISKREIEEAKVFYKALNEKPDPEALAAAYLPTDDDQKRMDDAVGALERYSGIEADAIDAANVDLEETAVVNPNGSEEIVTVDPITKNVFKNTALKDEWSYVEENAKRSTDAPYILHYDEYYADEKDYEQSTLTWFEEDGVLVNEKDQPIPEADLVCGDENLKRFGHGSKDKNVVYIRNDRLQAEYEVLHSSGSYVHEVLGIQHSDDVGSRRRRRSRFDDE